MIDKEIKDIEPNDMVLVLSRYDTKIYKVLKCTRTQIVLTNGARYNRTTGRLIGCDSFNITRLEYATKEKIIKLKQVIYKKSLIQKCLDINFKELSIDQLESILKVLGINYES